VTTFVLATHNAHKVDELRRILGERLGPHELVGYDGPEAIEDGGTFAANALIKARAAAEYTGLPALADDSGISVVALGGAPGIHSARYAGLVAGDRGIDADNVARLIEDMRGVVDRTATFDCAAALVDGEYEHVELGVWPGWVLEEPAGTGGFGYDPVFRPQGLEVASAELTADEKNAQSHRARAFGALVEVLRARYG
jgi:XTP/dITP diphosphohydrolase